jgi:predicted nucleic acid-binding protein
MDTNILLRLFDDENEEMSREAGALITRVERGEERVATSSLVIFEVAFTLHSFYRLPRSRISEILRYLISLRGLELPGKHVFAQAIDIYASTSVSIGDAYNAAFMQSRGLHEIYSWDRGLDRIAGLVRIEPGKHSSD